MIRTSFIACICLVSMSACNHVPDHARYIPKDALVVVGINTKEIGKKIAWNAIMGNKLLEEMQKNKTGNAVTDPEEIGIELMSTSYVYIKQDKRFTNGARVTALVPLGSTEKWETFVKTTFPDARVKQQARYKDARLAEGMYAGWSDKLLVVMNTMQMPDNYIGAAMGDHDSDTDTIVTTPIPQINETQLAAEMDNVFNLPKENALTGNERFSKLEGDAHDVTLWINYDGLMEQYMNGGNNAMGISLSNTLWKDAALAAGFDFEKGKIAGDILYYVPDALKDAARDLGGTNADKEMLQRLPGRNLDMLMAWHISPGGVKALLEKTGMLGFINLALSGEGLSTDYILEAFTGDMAVSLNDFAITRQAAAATTVNDDIDTSASRMSVSGDMNYTYALKINKKENFRKLLQIATSDGGLQGGNNNYFLPSGKDTFKLVIDGDYCIMTNKAGNASGFVQGKFKNDEKPAAEVIYNNPFGIYFNAQSMMNALDPGISTSAKDSAVLAESKKLLKDVYFKGGDFKSSAFRYQMAINFINKDENSLLQLMDFAMRMNKAGTEAVTAWR